MNTKILSVLLVALIAALGAWFYYGNSATSELVSDNFVLTASFMCADASNFITEFAGTDSVNILVNGAVVRTVPFVSGTAGQIYENGEYKYVFAGEEVTVTNKASGTSTTCEQPFDPNLAPINFGDTGEGGDAQEDVTLIVSENIIGKWQSNEDPKFVREFLADGTVQDWYDGAVVASGTVTIFTSDSPVAVAFPIERNTIYLQLKMSGTQAETLNFKVGKLTPEALDLTYMDRGGVLHFTYVE